jgi:hypothetical protein
VPTAQSLQIAKIWCRRWSCSYGGQEPKEVGLIYEFIDCLRALDRALVLLYLDGNSHQEIAQVLGISPTNVATKIGRLKQAMQQRFGAASNR